MAPLDEVLGIFEGQAERLIWLPPITLGYIYTLSGNRLDFWLAVASVGGVVLMFDMLSDLSQYKHPQRHIRTYVYLRYSDSAIWKKLTRILVVVAYVIVAVLAGFNLWVYFDHSDLIIVSLSGIWWGILVTLLVK